MPVRSQREQRQLDPPMGVDGPGLRSRAVPLVIEHDSISEPRRHDGRDVEPTKIEAHGRVRVPSWFLKSRFRDTPHHRKVCRATATNIGYRNPPGCDAAGQAEVLARDKRPARHQPLFDGASSRASECRKVESVKLTGRWPPLYGQPPLAFWGRRLP